MLCCLKQLPRLSYLHVCEQQQVIGRSEKQRLQGINLRCMVGGRSLMRGSLPPSASLHVCYRHIWLGSYTEMKSPKWLQLFKRFHLSKATEPYVPIADLRAVAHEAPAVALAAQIGVLQAL